MIRSIPIQGSRTSVVLDADGLSKLARKDRRVREMIRQEVGGDSWIVAPPIAVIQSLVEGVGRGSIDRVLGGCRRPVIDDARIDLAAELSRRTGLLDVADALVAAEALLSIPAIIITSDPDDLKRLIEADRRHDRVEIWAV